MEEQIEQPPKTGTYALIYGGLLGALGVVFGIILFIMDLHYQGGLSLLIINLLITLAFISFGIYAFRKQNAGYISFGEALKIGVGIALIGGIIGIIYQQVLVNVLDPEFVDKSLELGRAQLTENTSLTTEQINQRIEGQRRFSTPLYQVAFGLIGSIVFGFILSLIPGLALKRSKNE